MQNVNWLKVTLSVKLIFLFCTEKWIGEVKFFVSFVCLFTVCVLTNFCTDKFGCVVANLCVKLTNCSKEAFLPLIS